MRKLSLVLAGLVLLAPESRSDVLQKSRVPAGARWLAHVDVEKLMASELFTTLKTEMGDKFEIGLDDIDELCGLNPMTDVKSVTFFSTNESDAHTVGVIVVNAKVDAALACFQREEGYHTLQVGARTLHVWNDDEGEGNQFGYILPIAGSADRLAVIGGKPEALVECVEVLEGTAPSLATVVKPNFSASPGPGAIAFAAACEPMARLADIPPASAIAKLAQAWTFEIGESSRALYADLWVRTATNEEAVRVQQVLQGGAALLGLAASDPAIGPKIQPVLSALSFTADGTHMHASFRYSVQDLVALVRAIDAADADDTPGDGSSHEKKRHEKKIRVGDEK
jgi:hypothetical protein